MKVPGYPSNREDDEHANETTEKAGRCVYEVGQSQTNESQCLHWPSVASAAFRAVMAARKVGQSPTNESQCMHWPSVASAAFRAVMAVSDEATPGDLFTP